MTIETKPGIGSTGAAPRRRPSARARGVTAPPRPAGRPRQDDQLVAAAEEVVDVEEAGRALANRLLRRRCTASPPREGSYIRSAWDADRPAVERVEREAPAAHDERLAAVPRRASATRSAAGEVRWWPTMRSIARSLPPGTVMSTYRRAMRARFATAAGQSGMCSSTSEQTTRSNGARPARPPSKVEHAELARRPGCRRLSSIVRVGEVAAVAAQAELVAQLLEQERLAAAGVEAVARRPGRARCRPPGAAGGAAPGV